MITLFFNSETVNMCYGTGNMFPFSLMVWTMDVNIVCLLVDSDVQYLTREYYSGLIYDWEN